AEPEDSVVKVIATIRYPDPLKPWAKGDPVEVSGSGVVIEGKRILTNAHVVRFATEVSIQPRPGADKIEAKTAGVGVDVDLAVLTVADDDLFKKRPALPLSKALPKVQDGVAVYGFPVGGDDLSVTKGVVSRVGFVMYPSQRPGPVVQVSAAINPGNSGGPAVVDGKMVGLVYSRLNGGENIGYIIPCEEVTYFLDHIKDGRSEARPIETTGAAFQKLENEALRRSLKLDKGVKGLLVHPPAHPGADSPFHENDVLTRIGDYDIDNAGMVRLKNDLLAPFEAAVPLAARDGVVPATILRDGQAVKLSLPVAARDNLLIRGYDGEPLPYFIHGPLVFAPVREDAIPTYFDLNPGLYGGNSPMIARGFDRVRFPGEELVVVTAPLFAYKIAKGYNDPIGKVVKDVNGVKIKNLRHLVETIRDCKDDFLTFHFAEDLSEVLVFDRKEMEKATEEILDENGIGHRGSPELLKIWNSGH
ncbi:MAG TPA: trypsin-like peptidase domain-containing protein, partial [Gemmataceae bacterium]|nr:trypsin-like peptidase domain-containing protein [Gemmataceae bacterium]